MAKDRAAPFSRKHRKYWIPVTGGMIVIGAINVALGLCSYVPPSNPQRMEVKIPTADARPLDAGGTFGASELPAVVMRAFAVKYPRTIPSSARRDGELFVVSFPSGAPRARATFRADGTFVSDE